MKLNRDSQTHINKHNVNLNVQVMAIQRFYSGEHVIFKVNISHSDEYLPPYKQNTLLPEKETFTVVYLGTHLDRGSLLEQTRPCSRGKYPSLYNQTHFQLEVLFVLNNRLRVHLGLVNVMLVKLQRILTN